MKKIILTALVMGCIGIASPALAQTETEKDSKVKKVGKSVKKGVKKAGHKTAELASKGKAKVTDKKLEDRVGPNGETIYVDDGSKYYWVDKRGARHFVEESQLRTKKDDN